MDNETPTIRTEPARLVIVDDHDLVREGLKAILSTEPGLEIIGEAANGREGLELCRRLLPDLVLMDVRMPEMDGLAATREIKRQLPRVSVLVLTVHENEEYMLEAIRAGASGYVLKDAPGQELATAIRKVLDGDSSLSRNLANRLLRQLANEPREPRQAPLDPEREKIVQSLTSREVEVLKMLGHGHTNRKIAEKLFISVGTVKNHVEHIFAKLEVSDRTQAVVRAFELKIIEPSNL